MSKAVKHDEVTVTDVQISLLQGQNYAYWKKKFCQTDNICLIFYYQFTDMMCYIIHNKKLPWVNFKKHPDREMIERKTKL